MEDDGENAPLLPRRLPTVRNK